MPSGRSRNDQRPAGRPASRHRLATVVPLLALAIPAASADAAEVSRGQYLASIMDCGGCHTPRDAGGVPIAGAGLSGGTVGFEVPGLGAFWPPNLTPDETGLAGWTERDIVDAIRTGVRPDGRLLSPAMPWANYAYLTDSDAAALAAYLRSLEPVAHHVPRPVGPGAAATAPLFRLITPDD